MSKIPARPLRSVLFASGSDLGKVQAAWDAAPDAVIIDIEDPQTPFTEADRVRVREDVRAFLAQARARGGGPLALARVQPVDTGQTMRDLRGIWDEHLAGVLLPKVT